MDIPRLDISLTLYDFKRTCLKNHMSFKTNIQEMGRLRDRNFSKLNQCPVRHYLQVTNQTIDERETRKGQRVTDNGKRVTGNGERLREISKIGNFLACEQIPIGELTWERKTPPGV